MQYVGLSQNARPQICLGNVWNPKTATFDECFLPVIAIFPAAIAAAIVLGQALRLLIPKRAKWMIPFVEEKVEPVVEIDLIPSRKWSIFTISTSILSTTALVLQLASALQDELDLIQFVPLLPWLVILLELLVFRPRTVPYAVLWILIVQCSSQAILVVNGFWSTSDGRDVGISSACVGLTAIVLLLFMPLRDPFLPAKDISQPFTEPSAVLRSPEEVMNLFQWMTIAWISPLMTLAGKRQLEESDVWQLPFQYLHRELHDNFRLLKGTVIQRLLTANIIDLIIITGLGLIDLVMNYAAPVLLQLILSAMEDPLVPSRVPLVYAFITLVARLIKSQVGVFSLWFGRRCYERSRGEMITMLHEKTLNRKISVLTPSAKEPDFKANGANGQANGAVSGDAPAKERTTLWSRLRAIFTRKKATAEEVKEPASMGKILNLMRNDVYEVSQRFWEFDKLVKVPLAAVFSMALVVNYLGWSSLIAVAVVVGGQAMSAVLARVMIYLEKKRRAATDKKLQVVGQFVEALRHLRWYGWQGAWLKQVLDARHRELTLKVYSSIVNIAIAFVNTLSLDITPVVAFWAYTTIAKRHLTVDLAFPALTLFGEMTFALNELPQLITTLINAWVAVNRIESFMAEPDRQEVASEALIGDKLSLNNASFAWPGVEQPFLKQLDLAFPEGLTVVAGEVASGKTALLQALLGEMDMLDGQLMRPQEPIGYCAQTPWLQSMSIRDNIVFTDHYNDEKYKHVLDACALLPDLAEFKGGDLAMIGENGIGLSGGQRARVALARAVYSDTKILFLDDPLSALDQQTAEAIVEKCLRGPLMEGRTIILVTHRTDLVTGAAQQIVHMDNGLAEVLSKNDSAGSQLRKVMSAEQGPEIRDETKDIKNAVPDKFIEDEHREHGGVKVSVYWEYIKAGTLIFWGILVLNLIIFRAFILAEAWFVKTWGEAYSTESTHYFALRSSDVVVAQDWISDRLPPPEDNVYPWLQVLLLLTLGCSFGYVVGQAMMVVIVYTAGKNMFRDIMDKVAHATFRFYDVTPVGRLMNRMTSDIGVIDGGISQQFQVISWMLVSWISSVVVIGAITPAFLVFTVVLAILFTVIFRRFIPTSQSLRRLEMVSLTPLMSNFGALLNGLATVRAFHAQEKFQDKVIEVVDIFQKMDHFYWSSQSWLTYRYNVLSAFATFFLFVLALATNLSAGLTAFVLLNAQRFVSATNALCKQYGQLQMEFVSVERVVELLHLEQEPKGTVSPPAWWPSFSGDIIFDNVTIKYAPHLDPALSDVSFTLKGGSKTAVIGRTGSGKSTLALAILATILPDSGSITIDNVDLAEVDKQLLRTKITFLAQDPVLFPGTMRENLDPVNEHSDEECAKVLQRTCEKQGWELETKVEAGGKNLSQGQRQLVGLARAVLRRSAIIILDEATASIDRETAMQIQQIMHEEMKDSTVITIAHRLEAVRHADYCLVLGKGKVIEQGPASEMLREHHDEVKENLDED